MAVIKDYNHSPQYNQHYESSINHKNNPISGQQSGLQTSTPLFDFRGIPISTDDANIISNENFLLKETGDLGEPFFMALDNTLLPSINPAIGIYPIPTLGFYCDSYPTFEIKMLLKNNGNNETLKQNFPLNLQTQLAEHSPAEIEFYFIVAGTENMVQTMQQHNAPPVVNLLCHAWKFPLLGFGETYNVPTEMGIFMEESTGVSSLSTDDGISFNALSSQMVSPHPADQWTMCCSPNNARFTIDPSLPLNDYWAVAQEGDRWIITYNVLLNDSDLCQSIAEKLESATGIRDALKILDELSDTVKKPELKNKWSALIQI